MSNNVRHPTLDNQMANVPNTPQFQAGNAILVQLQQIAQQITEINTRLDGIEARLGGIDTKVQVG